MASCPLAWTVSRRSAEAARPLPCWAVLAPEPACGQDRLEAGGDLFPISGIATSRTTTTPSLPLDLYTSVRIVVLAGWFSTGAAG